MPATSLKHHVVDSCRHLLVPVVRFLLRHGVSFNEFAELAKGVYVTVARDEYGIAGRPTNNARVAILTGLSRREVARVRSAPDAGPTGAGAADGNRLSRILTGWHVDPEFADARGQPAVLPAAGDTGSFASLLRKYGGDLPHVALQKEMRKRGLIEELPDDRLRVLQRDVVYSVLDPEVVQRMGSALHDHAATLDHNLNDDRKGERRFEAVAENARVTPRAARSFQRLVEARGLSFLEEIDAWLSEHEIDPVDDTNPGTVRLGVGVYLIQEND